MKSSVIKGFELQVDLYRLNQDVIPEGFDISNLELHTVDYFKKYGYRVSSLTSELYSRYNGIVSEKYVNPSLYYYYIVPFLTKMQFVYAYDDKCLYSKLFPNMKQPKTIVKNMDGRFFVLDNSSYSGESEITVDSAVEYLRSNERCIVKPSMSWGGEGIQLIFPATMDKMNLRNLLVSYGKNFIVQEVLRNHETLSLLNETSLNTCRIYTYRRVNSNQYVFLGSVVRFGGEKSFCDNASYGGGFCRVNFDGLVDDKIFRYKCFDHDSLRQSKGIERLYIPKFDEMVKCCMKLHEGLPYNDLVGWDVTLDEKEEIVLIEYNYAADAELLQISGGPMFGEYTDELMEQLTQPTTEDMIGVWRSFVNAPEKRYCIDLKRVGSL